MIPSTTAVPDIVNLSTDYLSMTTKEDRIHTITDFLSRPIIVHSGSWSSTTPDSTQLYTANFPEALIADTMYREKLRGFVGLRATLVVKVQVNSQPFQQGRLMLQYIPYAQYMPIRVNMINSTLQGRSGCPRTDLDLSVGTEIEMRIPYVSPHVYYNLITGQGSFGSIYLVVYSQLRDQVSGSGSVEYTVWAHLEDVDVQYPTGADIFVGNSPNFISVGNKILSGEFTQQDAREMISDETYKQEPPPIFAQVMPELEEMRKTGVISSGFGQVSEGLSTLSKLPVLGNFLTTPAWISGKIANIAKLFGFSKPTSQAPACESKLRGQNRMANFDGVDTSHKMALSAQNEIETKPGLAGTSADEMDLSRILSIPNFWDRFNWSVSNTTNSILWENYVTPMKIKPFSATITNRYRATHMGYLANAHGYWRGSIVYTFKFVKTQYHSGRLRISFIPFYFNSTISSSPVNTSRTQKIIVDLRTSTEVSFTVPYVSSRPWMFCVRPESVWLGTNEQLMYNAVTGVVRVEVLNQLVAANNVFQSIDCIVEVSGGPDLTFAAPTSPSYVPYSGSFTRMVEEEVDDQPPSENIIRAQVMGENEAIPRNEAQHGKAPQSIDTHPIKSNWSPEAHCIGEKIMSIRQLIKRFGAFFFVNLNQTTRGALLAPFSVAQPPSNPLNVVKTISMFEYYYFLYAFWRGSMRFKVVPTNEATRTRSNSCYMVTMWNSVQDTYKSMIDWFSPGVPVQAHTSLLSFQRNMGQSSQLIDPNVEGILEFEVPYYNVSHISPATVYSSTSKPITVSETLKGSVPPVIVDVSQVEPLTDASHNEVLRFFRAVGDDFSFLYLVGVPPLVNVVRPAPATKLPSEVPQ